MARRYPFILPAHEPRTMAKGMSMELLWVEIRRHELGHSHARKEML